MIPIQWTQKLSTFFLRKEWERIVSRRVKFSAEQKEKFVLEYRNFQGSLSKFCRIYNVERTAIIRWNIKYKNSGFEGLKEIKNKTIYSSYIIISAVKDYLENKISMIKIVEKYNLSGDSVLRFWLKWYNTPKWNKKIGEIMAREKISLEDKIRYVLEYLENVKTAEEIAAEAPITASQLRDWVRKYQAEGSGALQDKRGKRKPLENLTPEEKLKLKNKELEEENQRLKAEIELRKKLQAMEGRFFH